MTTTEPVDDMTTTAEAFAVTAEPEPAAPPAEKASATIPRRVGSVAATIISRYWGVLAILLVWQVYVSVRDLNSIVIPSPASVFGDLLFNPTAYLSHTWSTLWVAVVGLILGVTIGVAAAIATWTSPLFGGMVTPPAMVLRSVPVVAMIPVIARVFGYDIRTILAITVIISFFPSFVFTASGLRDVPSGTNDVFAVLGSRRWTRLRRLAIPSAMPNVFVAIRLSAANCVLAALIAEFLMGTEGLGYLFVRTRSELNMARSWGAALVATVLSVSAFVIAARIERWGRARFR